jgi:hypothetical protein
MGAITVSNLKWYQCLLWGEGDTHGGGIDTGNEVPPGDQNVFDDVSNTERQEGDIEYRKVYFKNTGSETLTNTVISIVENTPSLNDEISIRRGGTVSRAGSNGSLTGTLTFAASTTVTGLGTSFLAELAPGELIFNATDDDETDAKIIASIESDTSLTLTEAYAGTTGSSKSGGVTPISSCTTWESTSISIGDLAQDEYVAVWIKRVVIPGMDAGYDQNYFILKAENT